MLTEDEWDAILAEADRDPKAYGKSAYDMRLACISDNFEIEEFDDDDMDSIMAYEGLIERTTYNG